jgi:hypothetical protein
VDVGAASLRRRIALNTSSTKVNVSKEIAAQIIGKEGDTLSQGCYSTSRDNPAYSFAPACFSS